MCVEELRFINEGAELFAATLSPSELKSITAAVAMAPPDQPGVRLHGLSELRPFLTITGPVGRIAGSVLGAGSQPVRAIWFDKSAGANWSLPWHQDRTIAVKERLEVRGFGPWSVKSGMVHVEPPFDLLAGMVTLRIHLDSVPATNAPLLIAPESHKFGRIPANEIPEVVKRCGAVSCLANAGDIWLYATPILHASEAATEPSHRRVLQVEFAAGRLPAGLEWLGV